VHSYSIHRFFSEACDIGTQWQSPVLHGGFTSRRRRCASEATAIRSDRRQRNYTEHDSPTHSDLIVGQQGAEMIQLRKELEETKLELAESKMKLQERLMKLQGA